MEEEEQARSPSTLKHAWMEYFYQIPASFTEDNGFPFPSHPYLCPPEEFGYEEFIRRVAESLTHDRDGVPVATHAIADFAELVDRYVSERMFEGYDCKIAELNSLPVANFVRDVISMGLRIPAGSPQARLQMNCGTFNLAAAILITNKSLEDLERTILGAMTVVRLKERCREMTLPRSGCKAELIERILEAKSLQRQQNEESK